MQSLWSRWALRRSFLVWILAAAVLVEMAGDVSAAPGDRRRIGAAGEWKETVAVAVLNNRLYTVESSGVLYVTDLASGKWQRLGKNTFSKTRFLVAVGDSLYTIHTPGNMVRINPATGAFTRVGAVDAWKNTTQATSVDGSLYTVEAGGAYTKQAFPAEKWVQVGKPDFAGTRWLSGRNGSKFLSAGLYIIDPSGTLHGVDQISGV